MQIRLLVKTITKEIHYIAYLGYGQKFRRGPGLFLGIWNWGGIDECRGWGVTMREAQICHREHYQTEKNTLSLGGGGSSLNWGGGFFLGGCSNINEKDCILACRMIVVNYM